MRGDIDTGPDHVGEGLAPEREEVVLEREALEPAVELPLGEVPGSEGLAGERVADRVLRQAGGVLL